MNYLNRNLDSLQFKQIGNSFSPLIALAVRKRIDDDVQIPFIWLPLV